MKLHSVFLRKGCVLPDPLNPVCVAFREQWTRVEEIPSSIFDIMIRQAGWHFIWISGSCSRRGCARTEAKAIENALGRALGAVSKQSNAAEFDSVHVTKYLGFHLANVTVQRCRIQELSLLEADVRGHLGTFHTR